MKMRLYSSRSFEGLSLLQRSSGDIKEMSNLQRDTWSASYLQVKSYLH